MTQTAQEFEGGVIRARLLFEYLTEGATNAVTKYPGVMKLLPDGSRIGLRLDPTKPPTIDLHDIVGAARDMIELKFLH